MSTITPPTTPEAREEQKRLEAQLDKLRGEYLEMLNRYEEIVEKLKRYLEICGEDLKEADREAREHQMSDRLADDENLGYKSEREQQKKANCDELMRAFEQLKDEIDEQEEKVDEREKSPLEKKKEEVAEAEYELDQHRSEHIPYPKTPEAKEEGQKLKKQLDKLRGEYIEMLNRYQEIVEKLKRYLELCGKDLERADKITMELRMRTRLADNKDSGHETERKRQEKAAILEEISRILFLDGRIASKPDEFRIRLYLERWSTESEERYNVRKKKYESEFPWIKPGSDATKKEMSDYEWRMENKWNKDFWHDIQRKVEEFFKEHMSQPKEQESELDDNSETPDDQGSIWPPADNDIHYASFRAEVFTTWLSSPFEGEVIFNTDMSEQLVESIDKERATYQAIYEALGGATFSFPGYAFESIFREPLFEKDRGYGLAIQPTLTKRLDARLQYSYASSRATASFPIQTYSESNPEGPTTLTGTLSLQRKIHKLMLGAEYQLGDGVLQPLLGAQAGIARISTSGEGQITTATWQAYQDKLTRPAFQLRFALRWQTTLNWHTSLYGQWGKTGSFNQHGLSLSTGISF